MGCEVCSESMRVRYQLRRATLATAAKDSFPFSQAEQDTQELVTIYYQLGRPWQKLMAISANKAG